MMKTNTPNVNFSSDTSTIINYDKILLYSNNTHTYTHTHIHTHTHTHIHTYTHTGVAAMLVDVGQIFNGLGKINVAIACPPIRSLWFQLVNDGEEWNRYEITIVLVIMIMIIIIIIMMMIVIFIESLFL